MKINFVSKGSLNSSAGWENDIASTPDFIKNEQFGKNISELDKKIENVHSACIDSDYEKLTQLYFYPVNISGSDCFFAVRAKKNFSIFPLKNRYYDRREYFYFDFKSEINHIDFAASLPAMMQYEEKNFNVTPPEVKKGNYTPDNELKEAIFAALLTGNSVKIKVTISDFQEIESKILGALSALPQQYAKYLGFGFNLKDDGFSNSNLHIFNTLEDSGISLESLKSLKKTTKNKEFAAALLAKNYSDAEINLLNEPINKVTLYKLLEYHKLHFAVDNNDKSAFEKSKEYFEKFADGQDKFIKARLQAIYNFWVNNGLLSYELIQYIDNMKVDIKRNLEKEKEIIVKYQPEESDEKILYLIKNQQILDKEKITKLTGEIGLDVLLPHQKTDELLEFDKIKSSVADLINRSNHLKTKLKWLNKFPKLESLLKIEIVPVKNTDDFVGCTDAFINDFSPQLKKYIEPYVRQTIDNHFEKNYLTQAFLTAKRYSFKIYAKPTDSVEIYKLLSKNKNEINDADNILQQSENQIINKIPLSIENLLEFAEEEKNIALKQKSLFIGKLIDVYEKSNNKYPVFIDLLNNIIKTTENLWLRTGCNLYDRIKELKIENKEQIKELKIYIKNIKRIKSEEIYKRDVIDLIFNKITKYKEEMKAQKEKIKTETAEIIKNNDGVKKRFKILKIWAVTATAVAVGLAVYTVCPFMHNSAKKPSNTEVSQNDSVQAQPTAKPAVALNPLPNDTLKNSRGYVKIHVKGDSIAKVVDNLFKNNPKDLNNHYKSQKEEYIKYLIEANKDCFKTQQDACECDTLRVIPSYKQNKK
jgi:hypothetical protein